MKGENIRTIKTIVQFSQATLHAVFQHSSGINDFFSARKSDKCTVTTTISIWKKKVIVNFELLIFSLVNTRRSSMLTACRYQQQLTFNNNDVVKKNLTITLLIFLLVFQVVVNNQSN
jgi:hypothetical protein